MGKRANNQAVKSMAKKLKMDPALGSIADVIRAAQHLPEKCRTMLIETLPYSLGLPSHERHEIQVACVSMAEEVMMAKKLALEAVVTAEDAKLASLKASETELTTMVQEAQSALDAQIEKVQTSAMVVGNATSTLDANLKAFTARQEEQTEGDAKLKSAMEGKVSLEAAFQTHFKTPMEEGEGGPNFKELEPFLHAIELEPSLATALPSSCAKTKTERGNFDDLVLQEFEKSITTRLAALGDVITTETPASVERAVAVQAAKKDHEASEEIQKAAVVELEAKQKMESDRKTDLAKAREALDNFKPQLDALQAKLDAAKVELSEYEVGTYASFVGYKTKASPSVTNMEQVAPGGA
jgi:hypothetical protein